MRHHHHRLFAATAIVPLFAVSTVLAGADQIRRDSAQGAQTDSVEISLKIGSTPYSSNAPGTCAHAPTASIYGVLSEMWRVRQAAGGRSVQLTLWRSKKDGQDTFSLSVNDKKSVTISTVAGGQATGSGSVRLQPSGKGGTFTVDAKTASGETVTGTIVCPAFTPATAEGG